MVKSRKQDSAFTEEIPFSGADFKKSIKNFGSSPFDRKTFGQKTFG